MFTVSDFQLSLRTRLDKIDSQITQQHTAQVEMIQRCHQQLERQFTIKHDQLAMKQDQLTMKQDQLTIKQDQLFKLITGERGIGSPPHTPMTILSPSVRPRRLSASPAPMFAKSFSPSYSIPPPSPRVTSCSDCSAGPLRPDLTGGSDMQSMCESLMSELDFDITPFLEEDTPTTGAASTGNIVYTAPIYSQSLMLSGGCLPGSSSLASTARPNPSGGCLPGNHNSSLLSPPPASAQGLATP